MAKKKKIRHTRIIFKNGKEFDIWCRECKVKKSKGQIKQIKIIGYAGGIIPIYIPVSKVFAVVYDPLGE